VLVPADWKNGVASAPLPADETAGEWVAFGDAQTGKLDIANSRTRDTLNIVQSCERRDAEAVKVATRGPLWFLNPGNW
jgi:hypothetical protein